MKFFYREGSRTGLHNEIRALQQQCVAVMGLLTARSA